MHGNTNISNVEPFDFSLTKPLSDSYFLDRYDVFLLDLWGTTHDGINIFDSVHHFFDVALKANKTIIFVSNSSRRQDDAMHTLKTKRGLFEPIHQIITAGEQAYQSIQSNRFGQRFYVWGTTPIELPAGFSYATNIEEADSVLMTDINTPIELGLAPHQEQLDFIKALNKPIVCANSDDRVYVGDQMFLCAGFIARAYQAMGGVTALYGKPEVSMLEAAHALCPNIPKNRLLMVGDSLNTDIAVANRYDIDSYLVLTGLYQKHANQPLHSWLEIETTKTHITPTYCFTHIC